MNDTELLTVTQAANALSASSQTVRNWIRAERLGAVRIGSRFLIPRVEVERLRGDLPAASGESPWDFDGEEPPEPLPRAGARHSENDSAESLLGG